MVMLTTAILKMVSFFFFFFVAKVLVFLVGDYRFVLRYSVNFIYN
jgi:hypothetical protein